MVLHKRFITAMTTTFAILGTTHAAPPPTVEVEQDDEAAYQRRADFYIRATSEVDLDAMHARFERSDYFRGAGGDRHKYAMGPVIARLYRDPADEQALRMYRHLMAVDKLKDDRGIYHFSSFQKTRMYFLLADKLPEDIRAAHEYDVRHFYKVMTGGGTENHYMMNRTSGYVWADRLDGEFPGAQDGREAALAWQRAWLIDQVRRNYSVGNGEYDSSTYLGFSAASWANIYDFAQDPAMRDWARAMLDWYAVAMARKYYFGLSLGPESRGFAKQAVGSKPDGRGGYNSVGTYSDWLGWLWWEASDAGPYLDRPQVKANPFPALNLALSGYRPHRVIRNIAQKQVPLPYEARGAKARYQMDATDGTWADHHNHAHEYLYINSAFAMGTLYTPDDGIRTTGTILPQTTMFKLAARAGRAVHAFGISNSYHRHFALEGRTPYDQYHQSRGAAINICYVDAEDDSDLGGDHEGIGKGRTAHRSVFGYPAAAGRPTVREGWYFWEVGDAFIATRPLGAAPIDTDDLKAHTDRSEQDYRFLVSPGRLGGWVVQAAQRPQYPTLDAFADAVIATCTPRLDAFDPQQRTVSFTSLEGQELKMQHTGGPGGRPRAWIDQQELKFENWPVYESPYVRQAVHGGALELSDGQETLTIKIEGDAITWTEGVAPEALTETKGD